MELGCNHSASRSSSTTCSGHSTNYYHKEPTSPKLQEVARYLSELVGSYDTEKLCRACLGLADVIKEADRDCLHLLSERDVVGVVIKVMEDLPSHSSAQQAGCEVLLSCNDQIELRSSIEDRNAYQSVLSAMRGHPNDPQLLRKAVHALASFASTALSDTGLKENKAYSYVLKAISENRDDATIQSGGLKALANLLKTDQYAVSNIARQGEHRVVYEALSTHSSNADIVAYGFQTLQIIAGSDSGVGILLELTDILVLLMEQLQAFSDSETVVTAASGLIDVLTAAEAELESDPTNVTDITSTESMTSHTSSQSQFSNQVVQLRVLHLLTELLEKYTEVLEIQIHTFSSIEHICVLPEIEVSDTMLEQWLHLLSDAFNNHGHETAMMEAGCRCLARMLELNAHLHTLIGADSARYQIPLHNSVWITLLNQSNEPNPSVFRAVTMALFFLVEDDESLQQLLLEKGASEALLECLREYLHEETKNNFCVECGCRALRGMLRNQCNEDHKDYLVTIGIVADLGRILDDFVSYPDVISEVFCVIACLADLKSFQQAVLQCSLCKLVLQAVERHAGHDILVESALEVLILLSQNAGLVPLLHDVDVLGATVAIMRKHVVSPAIQCKGCMLIRLLSGSQYLISKPLCTSIAKVVIDALSRKTDINVQTEALACTYTLCECSPQMSEALVRGDVHLILFTLLYREASAMETVTPDNSSRNLSNRTDSSAPDEDNDVDNFIFQVGTDIIYTLSCVRDFKQEMLTTAVQDGLLEGVKVLVEIGADVNFGEEADTPVCLAVHSNDKEMVEFLLHNGVNDVHKALSIAREKKLDEITGLLLEHLGLDRNGDVVNLSGLELKTIKPTWILPSLGIKYSPPQTRHRRNRSLGKLNEMLKHRKSVDLGLLKVSEHTPFSVPSSSDRHSVAGMESLTSTRWFRTRFGNGGRASRALTPPFGMGNGTSSGGMRHRNGPVPSGMENENVTPSRRKTEPSHNNLLAVEKKKSLTTLSSLRQKLNSGFAHRRSRSSTPSSSDSRQSSGDHEQVKRSKKFKVPRILRSTSKSPEPDDVQPTTPTRPKASQPFRVRRSGVQALQDVLSPDALSNYEPVLSPIKGTPTHQARKPSLREEIEEVDSGFENVGTNQSESTTTTTVISPEDDTTYDQGDSDAGNAVIGKPPHKPHGVVLGRRGTITGVEISRLPFSHVDGYSSQRRLSSEAALKQGQSKSQEEFSISPSQLFRQLKKFRKHRKRHFSSFTASTSSVFYTRLDSPAPVVYTRNDQYCDSEEVDPTGKPMLAISESASVEASASPNLPPSYSAIFGSRKEREASPCSDSSSLLLTPKTSVTNSIDVSYQRSSLASMSSYNPRESRDEVDFGGFEKIDEEAPVTSVSTRQLIKALDLSSNMLTGLRGLCNEQGGGLVFKRLRGVHRLDIKQNQICELPREMMQELRDLTTLNLSCNAFTVFPEESVLSQHLTTLDLSTNKISKMPSLPALPNLVRLNLSNNQLQEFPPTLTPLSKEASLPHLRFMNLQSNHITSVPNHDTRLKDLEELNISKNQIKDLPDQFIASVTSLKTLDASRNELARVAGEVAQDLVQLVTFKVAYNNLGLYEGDFNNFITSAPVLQTVDASENGLTSLPPPYAWKSRGVREIRMTGNRLTKLDLSDGGKFWPHLECFYLGENKLKEIPKQIGNLPSLSCLDISHNKDIKHLPNEMGNLDYLFMLNLQGLKNLALDPSLQNGSTKAIVSYLKSRHTRSVPYYHMKLMIIGAAAKGKTTLLNQLMSDKTIQPQKGGGANSDRNMATLGVSVKQWTYPYKPGGHGSVVNYHVSCWDFAGQEEFYSTHQCFLSQRSLYVLVYNLALGESELQYLLPWLLNVQARAPSSPVVIVGTHIDRLSPEDFERRRIMMRDRIREMLRKPGFPGDVSFGEVNCFDDRLVTNLRRKIKMLMDGAKLRGQKIMGGMVPSNYLALEELIQREKKRLERAKSRFPVLRASRLREMMDSSKLSQKMDKAETERAIQFLHECGVLLYYSDLKTKLSELYFLNPEWLCMLMAQIITISEINPFINKDGLMKRKSLPFVLKEPRFPSEFLPEYIRLLERFEVALCQTPDTLLIPSHLPKKKPSHGIVLPNVAPGSCITRRYILCYIPPGFWPRLIARLITFPKRALPHNQDTSSATRHVWSGGMYTYWSEQSYFLIDLVTGELNTFDIIVPTTNSGTKLLCSIVDNVEALIDEWFPGLRDQDILNGDSLVKPMSVCPLCPPGSPHCFPLKQLMEVALNAEEIECPKHKDSVLLELLAPDTVISDLEPHFKVSPGEFVLEEITKNFLGKGGFGEVYKAEFRGRTVAVKVFAPKVAAINNTTPNHLIRQEVQILSRCQHPYIISMVAVTLRPKPMLFMEFAELGSLNSFYPYSSISLTLKHKIAFQVAGALAFLHKCNVIYRDLKPDNILIFSLSTLAKVNAKLSDYGIACYATEGGLTQPMGTAGCKAPELLMANSSSMPYNDKVDIYSYGLMLFVIMTNGHKPFEELSAGYEIDKFIVEGRPINDIDHYGCPPWPDMQDLINHCLQYTPSNRPSAQEVFDRLCSTEFISLKRAVQVERDQTIDMFTTRCFVDKYRTKSVEVWMASVLGNQTMVSIMNLSKKNASPQGMMLPPGTLILSMVAVESALVLMGTATGDVFVYDGYDRKLKHTLSSLQDSVMCLVYFKALNEQAYYVCAGLANGTLAFYDQYILMIPNAHARILEIGKGPVTGIKRYHGRLYACCGSDIVVVRISDLSVEHQWNVMEGTSQSHVRGVEVGQELIWTIYNRSPKVQVWDLEDGRHRGTLHCDVIVNSMLPKDQALDPAEIQVTSVHLQPPPYSILWLGLASGHLLIISTSSRTPLMITRRHVGAISSIQSVKALVSEKPVHLILSAGFGFQQRPGYEAPSRGTPESYGNLLVWDSIMPRLKPNYDEVKKRMLRYR